MDEQPKAPVILVDENDVSIGTLPIVEAHMGHGVRHRAVSVLLYRSGLSGKELLLQKRSKTKLLWPLYWSNTICTHPRDGEETAPCAIRRLSEEMGIAYQEKDLSFVFKLTYQAPYTESLAENEVDSVFMGTWNGVPDINLSEVDAYRWTSAQEVVKDMEKNSGIYTPWFIKLMNQEKVKSILTI